MFVLKINAVLCGHLVLYRIQYGFERTGVVECQIGQGLAVEGDAFLCKGVDEAAVAQALHACGRVDTGDPQAAIEAFFEFPVAESVLPPFFDGVFGYRVNF